MLSFCNCAKVSGKSFDKYSTFFYFDSLRGKKDMEIIWQEIVQTLLLKDWKENHELYHKVGYLIASGNKNLTALYRDSQHKTKSDFLSSLDAMIKDSVAPAQSKNYSDWNYLEDKDRIRRLLLLFNVESVRRNGEQSQWFPSGKFNGHQKILGLLNIFTPSTLLKVQKHFGTSGCTSQKIFKKLVIEDVHKYF